MVVFLHTIVLSLFCQAFLMSSPEKDEIMYVPNSGVNRHSILMDVNREELTIRGSRINSLNDSDMRSLGFFFKGNDNFNLVLTEFAAEDAEAEKLTGLHLSAFKSIKIVSCSLGFLNIFLSKVLADSSCKKLVLELDVYALEIQMLAKLLPVSNVTWLDLTLTRIDFTDVHRDAYTSIAANMNSNSKLTHLSIASYDICDIVLNGLSRAFLLPNLENLKLFLPNVTGRSLGNLSPVLSSTNLKTLDLACNLDDQAAGIVSRLLNSSKLENLILDATKISDDGLQTLVQSLEKSPLTNLSLKFDPCGKVQDMGAKILYDSMYKSHISHLEVSGLMVSNPNVEFKRTFLLHMKINNDDVFKDNRNIEKGKLTGIWHNTIS